MKIEYFFTRLGGLLLGSGIIFGLGWMYLNVKEMVGAYVWVTSLLLYYLAYCFMVLRHAPRHMEEARASIYRYGFLTLREGWANLSIAVGGLSTLTTVLIVGAFFPGLLQ